MKNRNNPLSALMGYFKRLRIIDSNAYPARIGDIVRKGTQLFFYDTDARKILPLKKDTGVADGNIPIYNSITNEYEGVVMSGDGTISNAGVLTLATTQKRISQNLLINPSFDAVLIGTHTTAGYRNTTPSTSKNTPLPGWQIRLPAGGSPSYDFEQVSATIDSVTGVFGRITVNTLANGGFVEQPWNSTHYLSSFVSAVKRSYLNFSMNLRTSHASVSCKLFITMDGTGGSTFYSDPVTGTTSWTRAFVATAIPHDATTITIGIQVTAINAGGDTIHCDDGMVVSSPSLDGSPALTSLPFVPRLPIILRTNKVSLGGAASFAGGAGASSATPTDCDSASFLSTQWALNSDRPHWANKFAGRGYCQNSAAGEAYVTMEAKGGTATDCIGGGYTTAATYVYWWGECEIGQDGLIKVSISPNSNGYGGFYNKEWIGVGL